MSALRVAPLLLATSLLAPRAPGQIVERPPVVIVLYDDSASMAFPDRPGWTRLDALQAAFDRTDPLGVRATLERAGRLAEYAICTARDGEPRLVDADFGLHRLRAAGPETALADAVREAVGLERAAGNRVVAVVLVSDGASFADRREDLSDLGVPVHVLAAGDPTIVDGPTERLPDLVPVPGPPVRVFYVEETPRWEYRHLARLLRSDPGVEAKILLLEAEGADPPTPGDLEGVDVVLLGALSRAALEDAPRFVEELVRRIEAGTSPGYALLAGPFGGRGTALETRLPVERAERHDRYPPAAPFHPQPARGRLFHPLLRLSDDRAIQRTLWCDEDRGLQPLRWYDRGVTARSGEVLLRHPEDDAALLVVDTSPTRVIYVGTDETWRWRYLAGDRYYGRFWKQAILWLAGRLDAPVPAERLPDTEIDRRAPDFDCLRRLARSTGGTFRLLAEAGTLALPEPHGVVPGPVAPRPAPVGPILAAIAFAALLGFLSRLFLRVTDLPPLRAQPPPKECQ